MPTALSKDKSWQDGKVAGIFVYSREVKGLLVI